MTLTAGYDIGGAHLKVALIEGGRPVSVRQIPCALWRGVDQLEAALAELLRVTRGAQRHAVTMTGELTDVFPNRFTGVSRIVEIASAALGPDARFWMGRRGFGDAVEAVARWEDVASTNFLASATLAARVRGAGLLIDMGSTTTDIVAFTGGAVAALGLTDGERLRTGELVYTGLTRTPVMAVTTRGEFQGKPQTLARDPFATMADVRRVLGVLPDGVDMHGTADGRGMSIDESRARLARCFGRDLEPGEDAAWGESARLIAEEQGCSIVEGCRQVLGAVKVVPSAPIVTAGIGAEVASEVARRLGRTAESFGVMTGAAGEVAVWATRCAPAVAVGMLLGRK